MQHREFGKPLESVRSERSQDATYLDGTVTRNTKVRIIRDGNVVYAGWLVRIA